ncbi:MAG: hypothetical protein Athens071426_290 [Parcubacteria group bacterium Athens0714_26]|nr:MAG: hypothetical protein Athens101426_470 [Parcubacteria group bacterium Athens1014_26]TSD03131.1 MAG: hypothetical protein Athens071426_290 [Parcubacteria group bacterium Athens0714_26]
MAAEAGLSVKQILRRSGKSFLARELIINGKRCRVFYSCGAFKSPRSKSSYSRHRIASSNLREDKYDFLILFRAVEGYRNIAYVVPYKNFLVLCRFRSIKDSQRGEEIKLRAFYDFYMPLNDNQLHNGGWRGVVDLSGYKNAWHLMK